MERELIYISQEWDNNVFFKNSCENENENRRRNDSERHDDDDDDDDVVLYSADTPCY